MKVTDLRGRTLDGRAPLRPLEADGDVAHTVANMLHVIRNSGADAVRGYTTQFDGVDRGPIRVPQHALNAALAAAPAEFRMALAAAIDRTRRVHESQLPHPHRVEFEHGSGVEQRYLPIQRVGLYAPGGLAAYPSSVVMNVVPAQVAGVPSIAVASPPQADTGLPSASVLAACAALGVTEVYAMGGAQAIGAFAYGWDADELDDRLEPVHLITGPGNRYVAAAKQLVQGVVGIDAVAGPTEVLIIADREADPNFVAADLISQAEHDPGAASVLVTPSAELADEVIALVWERVEQTPNGDRVRTALTGPQSGVYLVDDLDAATRLANSYGPEHLQLMVADPRAALNRITNAGAIFLGPWSPVSLGDYAAGSNHVLPTSNTSRHSSGLSVLDFLRPVQVIDYRREGLGTVATFVETLAHAESLDAHAEAISVRRANEPESRSTCAKQPATSSSSKATTASQARPIPRPADQHDR